MPRPVQSKLLSLFIKGQLSALRRCRFIGATDLPEIMANSTERLLNLPGKLPFFATRTTEPKLVHELLGKLHPVECGRPLIRMGPEGDGGYLVPDDLKDISACFSPGVSDVAGFELDCANRGMKVLLADASVEKPPCSHPAFKFVKKFIGATTTGKFVSLEDWVATEAGSPGDDLLLQMDIEGFEYEAFLTASTELLRRFRIMVVEFHDLERLFCEPLFPFYRLVFEKLLATHTCVHIHPNNYCSLIKVDGLEMLQMAEFTFLRNDRVRPAGYAREFPHPLDRDNTNRQRVVLPPAYYRTK